MAATVEDSFTDYECTYLGNHIPELGGAWQILAEPVPEEGGSCPLVPTFPDEDQPRIVGGAVSPAWVEDGAGSFCAAKQDVDWANVGHMELVFDIDLPAGETQTTEVYLLARWATDVTEIREGPSWTTECTGLMARITPSPQWVPLSGQGSRTVTSIDGSDRNWRFEGDYGGCDDCGSGVIAGGGNVLIGVGGQITFELYIEGSPIGVGYTFIVIGVWGGTEIATLRWDDSLSQFVSGTPITHGHAPAGSYQITYTIPAGLTVDEIGVHVMAGQCDGCAYNDRPWEIRNLTCFL